MKTKICKMCQKKKPLTLEFYGKRRETFDGWHRYCKECISLKAKERYEKNGEALIQRSKDYYASNIEKREKYLKKNKEKIKEYAREYYRKRLTNKGAKNKTQ